MVEIGWKGDIMIDDLKVAISEKDIDKARRIMVKGLIESNYPHEVFKDAMELASEYNIFDVHNKEKFISNPENWNEDYLNKLKEKLMINFSRERFMVTYYVARKLDKENNDSKDEVKTQLEICDKFKDTVFLSQVGAAVLGAATIGVVAWLIAKRKKK